MNYKFVPRFYYSLSLSGYIKGISFKLSSKHNYFEQPGFNETFTSLNHARIGLRLLLNSISHKQLNVGVQAYSCQTVFQAIHKAGHKIIFIDITDEFKLDLNDLKDKAKNIDILIVTHTFGFPEDIGPIKSIMGDKIIIEDCSHSFLSKHHGEYTGKLGDAAIFSTGLGKFPPIGSGGFCVINNPSQFPQFDHEYNLIPKAGKVSSIITFIKSLMLSFMMKQPFYGLVTYRFGKRFDKRFDIIDKFSFTEYRSYPWAQKLLKNNMSFFNMMLHKQTVNAKLLSSLLINKNTIIESGDDNLPNFYIFPLLIDNRDNLFNILLENNIEPGKHFQKAIEWAAGFGYKTGDCPNTELIVNKILTVPVHYGVSKKTVEKIAGIINGNDEKNKSA